MSKILYVVKNPSANTRAIVSENPTGAPGEEAITEAEFAAWRDEQLEIATPSRVPEEVPAWRIKAVASLKGLTPAILAALDKLPEPARTVATFAWNEGNVIHRNSTTTLALAETLGLTADQLDDLFRAADALPV